MHVAQLLLTADIYLEAKPFQFYVALNRITNSPVFSVFEYSGTFFKKHNLRRNKTHKKGVKVLSIGGHLWCNPRQLSCMFLPYSHKAPCLYRVKFQVEKETMNVCQQMSVSQKETKQKFWFLIYIFIYLIHFQNLCDITTDFLKRNVVD